MRKAASVSHLLLERECSGGGRCGARVVGDEQSIHRQLERWRENDFVEHSAATYCSFQPAPRSTIALSYNSIGTLLASTHGDHTVKITSCDTGKLVKVLTGHRRTPWVVRFHPRKPSLLASGSLDHEVRLWDATTGQCIAHHTFGKPIASLAFHISSDILAIACGHKLYIWEYTVANKLPSIVLKTRRSMRAVHFHPEGHPVVLTAEVQDPSPTSDLPVSLSETGPYSRIVQLQQQAAAQAASATKPTAARPPPSQELPIPSPQLLHGASLMQRLEMSSSGVARGHGHQRRVYVPTAAGPVQIPASATPAQISDVLLNALAPQHPELRRRHMPNSGSRMEERERNIIANTNGQATGVWSGAGQAADSWSAPGQAMPAAFGERQPAQSLELGLRVGDEHMQPAAVVAMQIDDQDVINPGGVNNALLGAHTPGWVPPGSEDLPPSMVSLGWELPFPSNLREPFAPGTSGNPLTADIWPPPQGLGNPTTLPQVMAAFSAAAWNIIGEEQPPRVRLRLWRFDSSKPAAPLESVPNLKLQISDAVLCSEMGVHFSPCGRFLAATTACRSQLPQTATASPAALSAAAPALGDGAAVGGAMLVDPPPPRAERALFEVRVYSLDHHNFGEVMLARRIRAAHCLTSVQFSPTCDHLLLAYGKKHISLLRSLVADRGVVVPMHTILEVFSMSDMELVRVLPSGEDEINAACFHPLPGGGIAYGTKEGKLRLVAHDRSNLSKEPRAVRSALESQSSEPEDHPTERELQGLREWVLTQQWLQQHVAGIPAPRPPGGGLQQLAAVEQQALQLLQRAQQDATRPPG